MLGCLDAGFFGLAARQLLDYFGKKCFVNPLLAMTFCPFLDLFYSHAGVISYMGLVSLRCMKKESLDGMVGSEGHRSVTIIAFAGRSFDYYEHLARV